MAEKAGKKRLLRPAQALLSVGLVGIFVGGFAVLSQVEPLAGQLAFWRGDEAEAPGGVGEGNVGPSKVLGVTDEGFFTADNLVFRIATRFEDVLSARILEVDERLSIGGEVTLSGPITIANDIDASGVFLDLGEGTITASNVVYSLQGETGELVLVAGDGIAIDGLTIANTDPGSDQNIFKNIEIGSEVISAASNDDTFSLEEGDGVNISASGKTIVFSAENLSGWYKPSTGVVSLLTSSNRVGIGTNSPTNTLEIDSGTDHSAGLTFSRLTSASPIGIGGGKVLSVDSGGKLILVSDQTVETADDILPSADTGGTLFFNGINWASTTNLYHNDGQVGISNTNPQGRLHLNTNSASSIGAIFQGYSSQTANLTEWRNSAGSILSYIDSNGIFNGSANVEGSLNPGLTPGQITFQGPSGLTGSNNLFWDNTNGRLGVGTASPNYAVDLRGSVYIENGLTATPKIKFQDIPGLMTQASTGWNTNWRSYVSFGTAMISNNWNPSSSTKDRSNYSAGVLSLPTAGVNPIAFLTADTTDAEVLTRMVISKEGNVGIGTTAPTHNLEIAGTGRFGGSKGVSFETAGSANWASVVGAFHGLELLADLNVTDTAIRLEDSDYITVSTAGVEVMRFNSEANVGIGTSSPISKLHVEDTVSGKALAIFNETGNQDILTASSSGTPKFAISNDGNINLLGGANSIKSNAGNASLYLEAQQNTGGGTKLSLSDHKIYFNSHHGEFNFIRNRNDLEGSNGWNLTIGHSNPDITPSPSGLFFTPLTADRNFIINTGGNVGIGTTDPLSKLHLNGGTGTLSTGLAFGDGDTGLYENSANSLYMQIGGTDRWRFDGYFLGTNTLYGAGLRQTTPTATITSIVPKINDSDTGIGTAGDNILSLIAGGVNGLNVNSSGSVGIGITDPAYKLEVVDYSLSGAGDTAVKIKSDISLGGNRQSAIQVEFVGTPGGSLRLDDSTVDNSSSGISSEKNSLNSSITSFATYRSSGKLGHSSNGPETGSDFIGYLAVPPSINHESSLLSNYYGFAINGNAESRIANKFGLYVGAQTNSLTNYAIYTDGTTPSYFGGNVGIGTIDPTVLLEVSGQSKFNDYVFVSDRVFITNTDNNNNGYFSNRADEGLIPNYDSGAHLTHRGDVRVFIDNDGNSSTNLFAVYKDAKTVALGTELFRVQDDGNIGLNTTTFGTNAAKVLAISGSTAPTTGITDGIQLYAIDQGGLGHELVVMDESANATVLSPHNFSLIPDGRSEDMAWAFYSKRGDLSINADMTKALRLVEGLTGEQLIWIKDNSSGTYLKNSFKNDSKLSLAAKQTTTLSKIQDLEDRLAVLEEQATQAPEPQTLADQLTTFLEAVTFKAKAIFSAPVEFLAGVSFRNQVEFEDEIQLNQNQVGQVQIEEGSTSVKVAFKESYSSVPVVTLTPVAYDGRYMLAEVTEEGFTIEITRPQDGETTFNWLAFAAPEENLTGESGDALLVKENLEEAEGKVAGENTDEASEGELVETAEPEPTEESSPTPTSSPTIEELELNEAAGENNGL